MTKVKVLTNILKTNETYTLHNKQVLKENKIFMINLMSGPGAGKTSLLKQLITVLKKEYQLAVIEGDLYTSKDAECLASLDIPIIQLNTEGACHLDAAMIGKALEHLPLDDLELIIVENVGNLVCPAEFEIGEHIKMMVASTTEGNDKPLKYPLMFEKSSAVILNKIDLVAYTNFDKDLFYHDVLSINAKAKLFETSATTGIGIEPLGLWIKQQLEKARECL